MNEESILMHLLCRFMHLESLKYAFIYAFINFTALRKKEVATLVEIRVNSNKNHTEKWGKKFCEQFPERK